MKPKSIIRNFRKSAFVLYSATALAIAGPAAYAQFPIAYRAEEALADGCFAGGPAGHVIYMPKLDTAHPGTVGIDDGFRWVFQSSGNFTENAAPTARLMGGLISTLIPGYGWGVDITFTNRTFVLGSIVKELLPSCYVVPFGTGGPVDPTTWHFYQDFAGTLTGTGNYAGAVVDILAFNAARGGHNFQCGSGASGKNVMLGASGWLTWTVRSQPTNPAYRTLISSSASGPNWFGDLNFNLSQQGQGCTRTLGYWKNHPDDWPVSDLLVGGVNYTKTQLINILRTAPRGDATYILIHQLIAAKLNILSGASSSAIATTITSADNFLIAHPLGSRPANPDRAVSYLAREYAR